MFQVVCQFVRKMQKPKTVLASFSRILFVVKMYKRELQKKKSLVAHSLHKQRAKTTIDSHLKS